MRCCDSNLVVELNLFIYRMVIGLQELSICLNVHQKIVTSGPKMAAVLCKCGRQGFLGQVTLFREHGTIYEDASLKFLLLLVLCSCKIVIICSTVCLFSEVYQVILARWTT